LSVGLLDVFPLNPPRELFCDCGMFDRDCIPFCPSIVRLPFDCPVWPDGGVNPRHPGLEDCIDVPCRAVLLKKCWLLLVRLGIELGLACRSVELKLLREGVTGFAPVMTLAWRNVAESTLDCCAGTRLLPN
jgi:hypothetical protein